MEIFRSRARHGGAVYAAHATVDVVRSVFEENRASEEGGAFYVLDAVSGDDDGAAAATTFAATESTFLYNVAAESGAVFVAGTATLTDVVFRDNEATEGRGGALRIDDGFASLLPQIVAPKLRESRLFHCVDDLDNHTNCGPVGPRAVSWSGAVPTPSGALLYANDAFRKRVVAFEVTRETEGMELVERGALQLPHVVETISLDPTGHWLWAGFSPNVRDLGVFVDKVRAKAAKNYGGHMAEHGYVVFADALGRRLASERAFARDEPLRGDFEPPPRAPPVWDYLSPETRRLIAEAAAASRVAFAEADAKRAAAGEGDAAEDEGYAAEDG